MKVAHIFWSLTYGGIETMLVNIANGQAKMGAEVHVVIINDLYKEELLGQFGDKVTVHNLHRKYQSKGISFIFRLNSLLMKLQPDAIHLHDSRIYTFLWRKRLSRVASTTLHDLPTGSVRRGGLVGKLLPFLFKSSNVYYIDKVPRVFAISDAVKDALWKRYGVHSIVVCNGILTRNFALRNEHMPNNPLRIVMVSRLEHNKKGQDLLIEAAVKLNGLVHVDFIGDGSSRGYLENMVKRLNAEEYVSFMGTKTQPYIAEHLCEYDLFVQPSRWEGFGLTVAEAMASNVPVLVSAGQGPAEVTCGEQYGWTFENGNVEDLTSKINHIIEHYKKAMEKSNNALNYVRNTYDVAVTARKYLSLYGLNQTCLLGANHNVELENHWRAAA